MKMCLALMCSMLFASAASAQCTGKSAACNGTKVTACTGTVTVTVGCTGATTCHGAGILARHHANKAARLQRRTDRHAAKSGCAVAAVVISAPVTPATPTPEKLPNPKK